MSALDIEAQRTNYEMEQQQWLRAMNLKPGDKLMVLRKADNYQSGWNNFWTDEGMEAGVQVTFHSALGAKGIVCDTSESHRACFPFFVLAKCEGGDHG